MKVHIGSMDFKQGLNTLEKIARTDYSETEKKVLDIDVRKALNPTGEEWMHTIGELRKTMDFLPKPKEIIAALRMVRNQHGRKKDRSPCIYERCDGLGVLMAHYPDGRRLMGCGCENTPGWLDPQCWYPALHKKGIVNIEHVASYLGKPVIMDDDDYRERRWSALEDLVMDGKWIPEWIQKRFDAGNRERITRKEIPKQRDFATALGTTPKIGKKVPSDPSGDDAPF